MLNAGQLRDYCTATNQLDHWYHHQVLINITDMLGQVLAPMGRTLGADAATSAGRVSLREIIYSSCSTDSIEGTTTPSAPMSSSRLVSAAQSKSINTALSVMLGNSSVTYSP